MSNYKICKTIAIVDFVWTLAIFNALLYLQSFLRQLQKSMPYTRIQEYFKLLKIIKDYFITFKDLPSIPLELNDKLTNFLIVEWRNEKGGSVHTAWNIISCCQKRAYENTEKSLQVMGVFALYYQM